MKRHICEANRDNHSITLRGGILWILELPGILFSQELYINFCPYCGENLDKKREI